MSGTAADHTLDARAGSASAAQVPLELAARYGGDLLEAFAFLRINAEIG